MCYINISNITGKITIFLTSCLCLLQCSKFKLVVIGGGAGGCSVAAKFAKTLPVTSVAVIEPSDVSDYRGM